MQQEEQEGTGESFIYSMIIGNGRKKISVDVLEMLIDKNQRPLALFYESNNLMDYLKRQSPADREAAIALYNQSGDFSLLRIGPYLAHDEKKKHFLLFAPNLIQFLKFDRHGCTGFSYKVNKFIYCGQFRRGQAEGKGSSLMIDGPTVREFKGRWRAKQIVQGESSVYNNGVIDYDRPLLHYRGEFKNFNYQGLGQLTKDGKTVSAKFEQGIRLKKDKDRRVELQEHIILQEKQKREQLRATNMEQHQPKASNRSPHMNSNISQIKM